jgi:hypothetical protein
MCMYVNMHLENYFILFIFYNVFINQFLSHLFKFKYIIFIVTADIIRRH